MWAIALLVWNVRGEWLLVCIHISASSAGITSFHLRDGSPPFRPCLGMGLPRFGERVGTPESGGTGLAKISISLRSFGEKLFTGRFRKASSLSTTSILETSGRRPKLPIQIIIPSGLYLLSKINNNHRKVR